MHKRREFRDDELISTGFKANGRELNAIHLVAEKEGYDSTSKWFKAVVMPIVAEALGVPLSDFEVEPHKRGQRLPSAEAKAAAAALDEATAVREARLQALALDFQHRLQEVMSAGGGASVPPPAARPAQLPPVSRRKR